MLSRFRERKPAVDPLEYRSICESRLLGPCLDRHALAFVFVVEFRERVRTTYRPGGSDAARASIRNAKPRVNPYKMPRSGISVPFALPTLAAMTGPGPVALQQLVSRHLATSFGPAWECALTGLAKNIPG